MLDEAQRCRRLAASINDPNVARLNALADEYERRANASQPPRAGTGELFRQASPDADRAATGGTTRSGGNGRSVERETGEGLPPLASYRSASASNRLRVNGSALPASSRTRCAIVR